MPIGNDYNVQRYFDETNRMKRLHHVHIFLLIYEIRGD